jgi:spore maturation protein CgeB
MADYGHCPSGRLFEAAACGCPVLSDTWDGLDQFYTPGEEILIARSTDDAVAAMELTDAEIRRIALAARDRTMVEHTSERRAVDFEDAVADALADLPAAGPTAPSMDAPRAKAEVG